MRTLFAILLISCSLVSAQKLHFRYGNAKNVTVQQLDIHLQVTNDILRATVTANFFNPRSRIQEGELNIPLPPDATISNYELEVNGQMKLASVVDKDTALRAYEEIKARNVDPGIVEKKENNNFRIRVFPVEPQKTKKTSFSYVHRMPKVGDNYLFKLPIFLTSQVKKLKITVSGDCTVTAQNISFESTALKHTHTSSEPALDDIISISVPPATEPLLTLEQSQDKHFNYGLYTLPIPENFPLAKPYNPKKITILWGTSDVANDRDIPAEIELLKQYFQHNPNTEVTLHAIGYSTKKIGTYQIIDADWKKLQTDILALHFDGASSTTTKPPSIQITPDIATLLFSSNSTQINHLLSQHPSITTINSTDNFKREKIITELTQQRLTVISSQSGITLPSSDPHVIHYLVARPEKSKRIQIGYKGKPVHTFALKDKQITKISDNSLTKLHAQETLLQMTTRHASRDEIVTFCKKHQLVSDHTSMIVLETLRDYIQYKIEPADPQMLARYNQHLPKRGFKSNSFERDFLNKQVAHNASYSWHTRHLLPITKNLKLCQRISKRIFLKNQYDIKPYNHIEQWFQKVLTAKQTKQTITTQKAYLHWLQEVNELDKQRKKFFSLPIEATAKNEIFVSLRGFVPEQKVHSIKPGTDLKTFLHGYDLATVALYRNSHRITYNLASSAYKKTPLKTGDMIVALEKNPTYYLSDDPLEKRPFIIDDGTDLSKSKHPRYSAGGGTFGDPFGDGEGSQMLGVANDRKPSFNISQADILKTTATAEDWRAFESNLQKDPLTTYLKLKSNRRRNTHFYIHAARILYTHQHTSLARQVLSNIIAGEEQKITAKKRLLLWLIELQDYQHAIDLANQYDPKHQNSVIGYLLLKAHLLNKTYTQQLAKEIRNNSQTVCIEDLTESKRLGRTYDIHITGTSESTGILNLLKIEFKDTFAKTIPVNNIHDQGLFDFSSHGMSEYTMKKAVPGEYKISISNKVIATYQIDIVQRWGTPNAVTKRITIHTDGTSQWKEIHKFIHQFPEK